MSPLKKHYRHLLWNLILNHPCLKIAYVKLENALKSASVYRIIKCLRMLKNENFTWCKYLSHIERQLRDHFPEVSRVPVGGPAHVSNSGFSNSSPVSLASVDRMNQESRYYCKRWWTSALCCCCRWQPKKDCCTYVFFPAHKRIETPCM